MADLSFTFIIKPGNNRTDNKVCVESEYKWDRNSRLENIDNNCAPPQRAYTPVHGYGLPVGSRRR